MTRTASFKAAYHLHECVCHEDDTSLAVVLVSVVVKSMAEGTPESIGEETVKSVIMGMPDSVA